MSVTHPIGDGALLLVGADDGTTDMFLLDRRLHRVDRLLDREGLEHARTTF